MDDADVVTSRCRSLSHSGMEIHYTVRCRAGGRHPGDPNPINGSVSSAPSSYSNWYRCAGGRRVLPSFARPEQNEPFLAMGLEGNGMPATFPGDGWAGGCKQLPDEIVDDSGSSQSR